MCSSDLDVITLPHPDRVRVYAEDVPLFRGRFGVHGGNKAVGFEQLLRRPESVAGAAETRSSKHSSKEAKHA